LEDDKKKLLEEVPHWEWDPIDARWASNLKRLQRYKADNEGRNPLPKELYLGFRIGSWVVQQRVRYRNGLLSNEQVKMLEALEEWVWDPDEAEWIAKFEATSRYAQREGHVMIGVDHREDGLLISKWCTYQRHLYKRGKLSKRRIELIESIYGWQWDTKKDPWMTNFLALKKLAQRSQVQFLPDSSLALKRPLLTWIRTQRRRYATGSISSDQVALLSSIPGWTWNKPSSQWDAKFSALSQYATETGSAMAPQGFINADGVSLGSFCQQLRNDYRRGVLSPERIARIETLAGWEWYPFDAEWREKYESLRAVAIQDGSLSNVAPSRISQTLRTWSSAQRTAYKLKKLDEEKIALLESIEGWTWDPLKSAWERGFNELQKYIRHYGHARVPHGHLQDGFNLGGWVAIQRRRFATKTINAIEVQRLETLEGWVWVATRKKKSN
jgi:hypothetical protein